ncbi:hypothetical protein RHS03_07555, partial [Rhizoctonia solani]
MESLTFRQDIAHWGSGLVNIAWGRAPEKGYFKRVSKFVEMLAINSTIEAVTLPYFATDSIEWIRSASELPDHLRNMHPEDAMITSLNLSPGGNITIFVGSALLIPSLANHTSWSMDPWTSRTIEEKRLLIYLVGPIEDFRYTITKPPEGAYLYLDKSNMQAYAFAWVTFRAGVGRCRDYQCVISSRSTIRSNTRLSLEPHPFTFQALEMATTVAAALAYQNISIPYPSENLNDYIETILLRSYSAAWNSISNLMSTSLAPSRYHPAVPVLVAKVDRARVFGWLGLQLSVTLLSIIFLILQRKVSQIPLLGDVSLAAFYLDTTNLPESDSPYAPIDGALKVHDEDGLLKVKVV